ncbi:hypothetical protein BDR03DRAFT_285882 [Suillus americanus]|nr:hypothetical protein BDR03DRAFT_285882 [Suillus americanus]
MFPTQRCLYCRGKCGDWMDRFWQCDTCYSTNLSFQWRFPFDSSVYVLFCSFAVVRGCRSLLVGVGMQKAVRSCPGYMLTAPAHRMHLKLPVRRGFHRMMKQAELDSQAWVTGSGAWKTVTRHSYRKRMWKGSSCSILLRRLVPWSYTDLVFIGGIAIILSMTYDYCHSRNLVVAIIMDHVGRIRLLRKNMSPLLWPAFSLSTQGLALPAVWSPSPLKVQWKLV